MMSRKPQHMKDKADRHLNALERLIDALRHAGPRHDDGWNSLSYTKHRLTALVTRCGDHYEDDAGAWLTVEELAALLRLAPATVRHRVYNRPSLIPPRVRLGGTRARAALLWRRGAVDSWLKDQSTSPFSRGVSSNE